MPHKIRNAKEEQSIELRMIEKPQTIEKQRKKKRHKQNMGTEEWCNNVVCSLVAKSEAELLSRGCLHLFSVSLSWFHPLAFIPSICLASLHTIFSAVILPFLLSAISSSHSSPTYPFISISFQLSFFGYPAIGLTNFLTLYVSIFPSLCQSSLSLSLLSSPHCSLSL